MLLCIWSASKEERGKGELCWFDYILLPAEANPLWMAWQKFKGNIPNCFKIPDDLKVEGANNTGLALELET